MLNASRLRERAGRAVARQRGLSLVELMVGIALGLFVVAAASLVVTMQLGDNRRLLLETQLQQDLRAASDIITRELRRAGAAANTPSIVWQPGSTPQTNAFQDVRLNHDGWKVHFRFERAPGITGPFGFKLEGGVLKSLLGGSAQELTDGDVMNVTAFDVAEAFSPDLQVACPRDCPPDATGDTTWCWPTLTVRTYVIDIRAQSRTDPTVQRSLRSQVRLGNDMIQSNLVPASGSLCP